MTQQSETIFVVDDDFRVREALVDLFASKNLHCVAFASAAEYLRLANPSGPSCLVLDVSLPEINGLEASEPNGTHRPPTNRVYHRPWRRPPIGSRHEGRRDRFSDQALE